MTPNEYLKRVIEIGYDIHFNDGICWIKSAPLFYSPVIPFQIIEPGTAKPKMHKALLGYGHYVSDKKYATKYEATMLLSEDRLRNFGMRNLANSTRGKVRKGSRITEVRKIDDIEPVIDDMKEIEISKAIRIGTSRPPEYYVNQFNHWREWMIKQFKGDKGRKDYWGSFYNDTLIAYTKIYQIDETMFIHYSASHTDHLDKCPNDVLTFTILNMYKELPDCKRVSYGAWDKNRPSLNNFKEKYGFERIDLPVYEKYNFHVIPIAKKLLQIKQLSKLKDLSLSYLDQLQK